MDSLFLKKIVLAAVIISLLLSPFGKNIFIPKTPVAQAQNLGNVLGKAATAGVACFIANKVEALVAGALSRLMGTTMLEEKETTLENLERVPVVDSTGIKTSVSVETSEALSRSKNCVRDVIAKILLDWLVDQTVNWIEGGGNPKFVTDWKSFLEGAYQAGVGDVAKSLNAAFLCEPFALKLRLNFNAFAVPTFSTRAACTLDDILANVNAAYEDFISDFHKGSWIAYNEMWQPQNNYYGALLMTWDQMMQEGAAKKEAAQSETIANQGFLSTKKCVTPATEEDVIAQEWCDPNAGSAHDLLECVADAQQYLAKETKELAETKYCKQWQTTTPGKTVGDILSGAMNSDINYIVNAQDLSTYIAAIIDAAINRLTKAGVEGLKKLTTSEGKREYDYDEESSDNCQILANKKLKGESLTTNEEKELEKCWGINPERMHCIDLETRKANGETLSSIEEEELKVCEGVKSQSCSDLATKKANGEVLSSIEEEKLMECEGECVKLATKKANGEVLTLEEEDKLKKCEEEDMLSFAAFEALRTGIISKIDAELARQNNVHFALTPNSPQNLEQAKSNYNSALTKRKEQIIKCNERQTYSGSYLFCTNQIGNNCSIVNTIKSAISNLSDIINSFQGLAADTTTYNRLGNLKSQLADSWRSDFVLYDNWESLIQIGTEVGSLISSSKTNFPLVGDDPGVKAVNIAFDAKNKLDDAERDCSNICASHEYNSEGNFVLIKTCNDFIGRIDEAQNLCVSTDICR